MRKLQWDYDAWEDYVYWQAEDRQIVKKINQLIREIVRSPFSGTGKPEPLKGSLSGFWSRRINGEHRIVYLVEDSNIIIIACRGHYN
ncbi:MAG: Txe/YoeB family addiction module toxin [Oscillospiraceae bacterium]|nr:Txe/YoeB family addiction module toxin [Oscillospiraceae bacterium]